MQNIVNKNYKNNREEKSKHSVGPKIVWPKPSALAVMQKLFYQMSKRLEVIIFFLISAEELWLNLYFYEKKTKISKLLFTIYASLFSFFFHFLLMLIS